VEAHRARDPELAGIGPGAADHVGDLVGTGIAELERDKGPPDTIDPLVAHPAHDTVLSPRGAGGTARVAAHDLAQPAQLLGREIAAADLDLDGAEATLTLGGHVGGREVIEVALIAVGAGIVTAGGGCGGLLVDHVADRVD